MQGGPFRSGGMVLSIDRLYRPVRGKQPCAAVTSFRAAGRRPSSRGRARRHAAVGEDVGVGAAGVLEGVGQDRQVGANARSSSVAGDRRDRAVVPVRQAGPRRRGERDCQRCRGRGKPERQSRYQPYIRPGGRVTPVARREVMVAAENASRLVKSKAVKAGPPPATSAASSASSRAS